MASNQQHERCCPYGGLTAAPPALAILACGITGFATFQRSLFSITIGDGEYEGIVGVSYLKYGDPFFGTSMCFTWEDEVKEEFDTMWKIGKALSFVSCFLGALSFIVSTVVSCATMPTVLFFLLGAVYMICAICSGGMLIGLVSEMCAGEGQDEIACKLALSAYMAIAAAVLYLVAGIVTCSLRIVPVTPKTPIVVASAVTLRTTKHEDGATTKIEEVVNPDGSRQVTETKEVVKPGGRREVTIKTTKYASDELAASSTSRMASDDDTADDDYEGFHP